MLNGFVGEVELICKLKWTTYTDIGTLTFAFKGVKKNRQIGILYKFRLI